MGLKYFTCDLGKGFVCLVCLTTSHVSKEINVLRHYRQHQDFFAKLPGQKKLHKDAYIKLKDRNIEKLKSKMMIHLNAPELCTLASLKVSEIILK